MTTKNQIIERKKMQELLDHLESFSVKNKKP